MDRSFDFTEFISKSVNSPNEHQSRTIHYLRRKSFNNFTSAKKRELEIWTENKVYETVSYKNQQCVSVRWVCTMKATKNGLQPKVRLVARGFEENFLNC